MSFEEKLEEIVAELNPSESWLVFKMIENPLPENYKGRKKEGSNVEKPLVVHLKHAGTTMGQIQKYERKGWPIVKSNFGQKAGIDERHNQIIGHVKAVETYRKPTTKKGVDKKLAEKNKESKVER